MSMSEVSSDIKSGATHPIALFVFGMLFAAFLFPMIARQLGKLKAKGGSIARFIPLKFTSSNSTPAASTSS